jgi:hypothetical protein
MSIKTAANALKINAHYEAKKLEIIKQFDSLPIVEKQNLYNKYKGKKMNLCFISNLDKICIYELNKLK